MPKEVPVRKSLNVAESETNWLHAEIPLTEIATV